MWRCFQIDLGADDILMAKICRQQRKFGVDIGARIGPSREPMHRESVAEFVGPGANTSAWRFDAEVTQQTADRDRR